MFEGDYCVPIMIVCLIWREFPILMDRLLIIKDVCGWPKPLERRKCGGVVGMRIIDV